MRPYQAERDVDAGFFGFADWEGLDGHPRRPPSWTGFGARPPTPVSPTGGWAHAWIIPEPALARYVVKVSGSQAVDLMRTIPGAKVQHKSPWHRDAAPEYWIVPAASWRRLRSVVPALAAVCASYRRRREAEHRRCMEARR